MRFSVVMMLTMIVASCAATPKSFWIRSDGQRMLGDAMLNQQFEMARTSCIGERQKAALSGVTLGGGGLAAAVATVQREQSADDVMRGCMAGKGYMSVAADQVDAKQQELAAIEAERKRREVADFGSSARKR